jgi:N-acyl-D-aspartate/D-glutamate deacylase
VLDRQPKGLNMLSYVPVNPLLVHLMGYEAAKSRDATPEERAEMVRLLQEAIEAGACGWSAQRSAPGTGFDVQRDYDGTPFATDLMSKETALRRADGYRHILVNGEVTFVDGKETGATPGRLLRHGRG